MTSFKEIGDSAMVQGRGYQPPSYGCKALESQSEKILLEEVGMT